MDSLLELEVGIVRQKNATSYDNQGSFFKNFMLAGILYTVSFSAHQTEPPSRTGDYTVILFIESIL